MDAYPFLIAQRYRFALAINHLKLPFFQFLHKNKKALIAINVIALLLLLGNSCYRDFQLQKQYPQDLRNRIIGARLMEAGKLPYFYKWQKGDPDSFIDVAEYRSPYKINLITASPFFHRLLIPIADFPFSTISTIWLLLNYACLLLMLSLALRLCNSLLQKGLVVNAIAFFTYTEAWILHNMLGQIYVFITALIFLVAYLLIRNKPRLQVLAGVVMAALILVRPNAAIVLLPFLLFYKNYARYIVSTCSFLMLYGLFVMCNKYEYASCKEYAQAIPGHVKFHQGKPELQANDTIPFLKEQEGFNLSEAYQTRIINKRKHLRDTEEINFRKLFMLLTGRDIDFKTVNLICLLLIAGLAFVFFKRHKTIAPTILQIICFALLLYLITDFCSPMKRLQYYTVQFLPAILIPLLGVKRIKDIILLLLAIAVLLNITNTPLIPIRHTVGEIIILGVLLCLSIIHIRSQKPEQPY
jgi:hypothetical protein